MNFWSSSLEPPQVGRGRWHPSSCLGQKLGLLFLSHLTSTLSGNTVGSTFNIYTNSQSFLMGSLLSSLILPVYSQAVGVSSLNVEQIGFLLRMLQCPLDFTQSKSWWPTRAYGTFHPLLTSPSYISCYSPCSLTWSHMGALCSWLHQESLSIPSNLCTNLFSEAKPYQLPQYHHFTSLDFELFVFYLFTTLTELSVSPPEYKLHKCRNLCLFCSLTYPKHLE